MNCYCEISVKTLTKFKFDKKTNTVQTLKIQMCSKTGLTIDSSLNEFEESKDQPCEFYEETILNEQLKEIQLKPKSILNPITKLNHEALRAFYEGDKRFETFQELIE